MGEGGDVWKKEKERTNHEMLKYVGTVDESQYT